MYRPARDRDFSGGSAPNNFAGNEDLARAVVALLTATAGHAAAVKPVAQTTPRSQRKRTFMTSHADTRSPEATLQTVKDALRANAEELIDFTAKRLAHLGARLEWGSEDNFEVTETLAGVLAPRWGLPSAASLDDAAALAFWSTIAVDELGYEVDAVDGYPAGRKNTPVA